MAVLNRNGIANYQYDTSLGNTCFGDQPKTGFNNNALVVSTDEYCGTNEIEIGALAVVVSKPQLIAQAATVNDQLYPALGVPQFGIPEMVFTITSKTTNPSAAYTALGSGKITTVAAGTGPHLSFSDALFDEARWGDYSFAQPDPSGIGVWLATEYIPSAADQNPLDNWGTYVFEVNPFSFGQSANPEVKPPRGGAPARRGPPGRSGL